MPQKRIPPQAALTTSEAIKGETDPYTQSHEDTGSALRAFPLNATRSITRLAIEVSTSRGRAKGGSADKRYAGGKEAIPWKWKRKVREGG